MSVQRTLLGPSAHGRPRLAAVAVLVAVGLLAVPVFAGNSSPIPEGRSRKPAYTFAGVPWLASVDSAMAVLAARGYVETPNSRQKDMLHATGKLFDHYAIVEGLLDDGKRVIRWEITLPAASQGDPYMTQRHIYDDAVTEMETKYGRRRVVQERFRFPYERGDGRQSQALRESYATIRSEWGAPGRDHLSIEIDRAVAVVLVYESSWWTKTEDDRRKRKAKDL